MSKAALLLLLALATGLGAQEAHLKVSAPFVSRLKAQARQGSILLSWRESPDLKGPRLIYRSTAEITEANFSSARLVARLDPAVNAYEDHPPDGKPYFYAVLLEDAKGKLYKLFIPFRNKTSAAVRTAGVASEQALAARITSLSAAVSDDAVRLRFQASRADRELLLFRSTGPMRKPDDLLNAAPPVGLNAGATAYVDYPIPGLDYYYAVVDAGLFKAGQVKLEEGQNATTTPVQVPLGAGRVALPPLKSVVPAVQAQPEPAKRAPAAAPPAAPRTAAAPPAAAPTGALPPAAAAEAPAWPAAEAQPEAFPDREAVTPLPLLALDLDLASGSQLPTASAFASPRFSSGPLSPQTQKAVAAVLSDAPPPARPRLKAAAFPEDLAARGDSEAYGLQSILVKHLLPGDNAAAEAQLLDFLSVRHSEEAGARAHFYLGQAYYLQGKYQQACLELLLAQDRFYVAAQPWIDASLLALSLD
jgi:TolA-binding protein